MNQTSLKLTEIHQVLRLRHMPPLYQASLELLKSLCLSVVGLKVCTTMVSVVLEDIFRDLYIVR